MSADVVDDLVDQAGYLIECGCHGSQTEHTCTDWLQRPEAVEAPWWDR